MTLEETQSEHSTLRARREKLVRDHFEDEVKQDWAKVLSTFPHPRYELLGAFDLKKPGDWARITRTVLGAGRMLL